MTAPGFVTYSLALAVAAAIPGPGIAALVARALGSGFRRSMPFLAGLAVGDILYLAAACFGLALVAEAFGDLFAVIRYGSAAYLAYLAIRLWRSGVGTVTVQAERAASPFTSFLAGLAVTLGNPKVIFFYLAILPGFLDLRNVAGSDFAILGGLTAAVLAAVLTPYAALAAKARGLFRTPRALVRLNRTAAAVMLGAAALIAFRPA